ncbi:MAG: hypothetical protein DWQ04_20165 [Chloroflexi bacterium]|nr:MAG: hypothetical protein DWQ04_20165 [Chloroflexota bacterium]
MSNHTNGKLQSASCPACGSRLRFKYPLQLGEFVVCDECDTELEVLTINPLKLDWAYDDPYEDDDDFDGWTYEDEDGKMKYVDEDFVDAEGW